MDLGLKGKVALVTGAGSQIGYGKGIALTPAREGFLLGSSLRRGAKPLSNPLPLSNQTILQSGSMLLVGEGD
jgi:NAD(P)-dependent dehydrogenase (short-subunit alcohol dehydrogenase family)